MNHKGITVIKTVFMMIPNYQGYTVFKNVYLSNKVPNIL